jgi:hypothetical protein
VVGVFLVKVALSPAQYVQFSDPDFADVGRVVSLRIEPADALVAVGATQQLRAIATLDDGTTQDVTTLVVWSSSDASIATLSNDPGTQGLARGLTAGVITPTASLTQDITASSRLTVTGNSVTSLVVAPPGAVIPVGQTLQYSATAVFSDGTTQDVTLQSTWASSVPGTATVGSGTGLLTGVAPGALNVTATFNGLTGTVPATITAATLTSLSAQATTVPVGGRRALRATGVFSDGTVGEVGPLCTWTVANPAFATNVGDQVTGVAVGGTSATATLSGQSSTAPVTVVPVTGGPPS